MWPINFNLAWILLSCQLTFVICTEDHLQDRAPEIVIIERQIPVPISTWTTFITVTITTTLGQPGLPTSAPPPFVVTVPAPTRSRRTRSRPTPVFPLPTVPLSTSTSSIPDTASSSLPTSTLTTSGSTTNAPTTPSSLSMAASIITASSVSSSIFSTTTGLASPAAGVSKTISTSIFSGSTMSTISTSSASTILSSTPIVLTPQSTSSTAQNNETGPPPWLPKPEGPLYGTKIAAIVAGVVSFLVFVVLLGIFLRYHLMQHRQRGAQRRQQLDMAPAVGANPVVGSFYSNSGTGHTGSLRGGEIRVVIQSPSSPAVWSGGLWPSPPGYNQRFTFHSGRSTTTDDDAATATVTATTTTDRGQWSLGTENGSVRAPRRVMPMPLDMHPIPAEKDCPPYRP